MRTLFLAVMLAGLLMLGCASQSPGAGGSNGPAVSIPNITVTVNNETIPVTSGSGNGSQQPPAEVPSQYAAYDLSVAGITLNDSQPTVSFYQTVSVEVKYEGQQKPSRYKVTYSDNGNQVETKTIVAPSPDQSVQFIWLPLTVGQHNLTASVQLFDDEKVKEDGPASNDAAAAQFEVLQIKADAGSGSSGFSSTIRQAQQFIVQNKIGIGSISVYLQSSGPVGDVPLIIELHEDDFNKPAKAALKTTTLTAKYLGSPQWYTVSYGLNGVFLGKSKYWLVVYLRDEGANEASWVSAAGPYAGKSMYLDSEDGFGNVWKDEAGALAFRVSTIPQ